MAIKPRESGEHLLHIDDLQVSFNSRRGENTRVLHGVSLQLDPGEILGVVGESGAGKSTIGNAITDLLGPSGQVDRGQALLGDTSIFQLDAARRRALRGRRIGYIFQDPMTSLNPVMTIGEQVSEVLRAHLGLDAKAAYQQALSLLTAVGIPEPEHLYAQYPHQFSGGMRQRVVIAIALACEPELIIADEPTTALDVSLQNQILELITQLCKERQVGCLLVTHDMGVVAEITDRVAVLYRGELVEIGPTKQVLAAPGHPYTQSLISAVPRPDIKLKRFPQVEFIEKAGRPSSIDVKTHWLGQGQAAEKSLPSDAPLLAVEGLNLRFVTKRSLFPSQRRYVQACDNIRFSVQQGETFGLVGGSGSGKSTVARVIAGLYQPDSGSVTYAGQDIQTASPEHLQAIQMVFQNPYASLNPRMNVHDSIAEPMLVHGLCDSPQQRRQVVDDLLDHVGLGRAAGKKYPHEFSGGQRQRISIARALATRPSLLICDEPTSALDVSVQAQILNLIKDLQDELGLTCLFISHDFAVVRQMCSRIAVMKQGKIVEIADTDMLFDDASHPYTQALLAQVPKVEGLSRSGLEALIESDSLEAR